MTATEEARALAFNAMYNASSRAFTDLHSATEVSASPALTMRQTFCAVRAVDRVLRALNTLRSDLAKIEQE